MEITQEILNEEWVGFGGVCPFSTTVVECAGDCMTVKECNDCPRSEKYRQRNELDIRKG